MSIRIRRQDCIGCGKCTEVCPGNLLKLAGGDKRADILHPEDCWGCTSCIKECPVQAIDFFLQPDVGGRGTTLSVKKTAVGFDWTFTKPDKSRQSISINSSDSNKY